MSQEFVTLGEDGSSPVIVQRIGRTKSGEPYHSFSWRCPNCGTRLPGYKPVLASAAQQLIDQIRSPRVFFFDRVSRGAILLDLWLPEPTEVRANVSDLAGRRVRALMDPQFLSAGHHAITWDGLDGLGTRAPAGIYFARVVLGDGRALSRRIVVHH